jgi:hypothetical protein
MSKRISFKVTRDEVAKIEVIADRAVKIARKHYIDYSKMEALMDITATHANGCPLRLGDLAIADDFNLAHDVFGIRRHLNRKTGQLEDCFIPRYAQPSTTDVTAAGISSSYLRAQEGAA